MPKSRIQEELSKALLLRWAFWSMLFDEIVVKTTLVCIASASPGSAAAVPKPKRGHHGYLTGPPQGDYRALITGH